MKEAAKCEKEIYIEKKRRKRILFNFFAIVLLLLKQQLNDQIKSAAVNLISTKAPLRKAARSIQHEK